MTTQHVKDDTDGIKTKFTIKEEVEMALDKHEDACKEVNDRKFIKCPNMLTQIFSLVGLFVMVAAAIGGYWKIESGQNERDSVIEIKVMQQKNDIDNTRATLKELVQKIDENKQLQERNQNEILQALRKISPR